MENDIQNVISINKEQTQKKTNNSNGFCCFSCCLFPILDELFQKPNNWLEIMIETRQFVKKFYQNLVKWGVVI